MNCWHNCIDFCGNLADNANMRVEYLTAKEAAKRLEVSTATIDRRRVPWQDQPVPFKIRFKVDCLQRPYFYLPDIEGRFVPAPAPVAKKAGRRRTIFERSPGPGIPGRQTTFAV